VIGTVPHECISLMIQQQEQNHITILLKQIHDNHHDIHVIHHSGNGSTTIHITTTTTITIIITVIITVIILLMLTLVERGDHGLNRTRVIYPFNRIVQQIEQKIK